MAVRVIIGRAGTGKTGGCLGRIVETLGGDPLGPAIFWIVPKQATFISERELLARTGGFCRASVVSFESLGEAILEECGGAAVPEITGTGRQMILGHVLRANARRLRFFSQAARQAGLAARLDATFAEFERCGRTSEDLGALLDDLKRAGAGEGKRKKTKGKKEEKEKRDGSLFPSLAEPSESSSPVQGLFDKVHDLKLIYDAYCAYLGQDRLDHQQRLRHVLACIDQSAQLRGATVFVDGFRQFTEYERYVLAQLAKVCASVEITLLMDPGSPLLANPHLSPEEMSLFHSVEQAYRRLHATLAEHGVAIEGPMVLGETKRFKTPALRAIERDLMKRTPIHREEEAAGIELLQAGDRRVEVDAVARRVCELWRQGVRLREICVLARNIDDYEELIAASFAEHGIAYFIDRRRPVAHHALVQFVRAAIAIALNNWPHDAVMGLIKSGLAGLTDQEADELENYALEHRVRGAAAWTQEEAWTFSRKALGAEDEAIVELYETRRMDELRRRIVNRLGPFVGKMNSGGQTIRSIALEVFQLFDRFGVREVLADWMKQAQDSEQFERREVYAQVWAQLVELLDQMVDLLGDEPAKLEDFSQILESGLEQFDLAIAPPTLDQVLVGQVDRTYTPRIRACFVLGLNEGVFPHAVREDTVLSDAERRELAQRNIEIDPDTQRRLLDEDLLAYLAFTRASERLIFTRSLTDAGGKPLGPSRYWVRLLEMFPRLKERVRTVGMESADPLDAIGTPRQLVTSLMRWVRSLNDDVSGDAVWWTLYQWLASHPAENDAIDVMRFVSWKALSYANDATLAEEVAAALAKHLTSMSVTRIETFAQCPFRHFSRYGLGLKDRIEADKVTSLDLGNVLHGVLEKIVRAMIQKQQNWPDLPEEQREQLIHDLAREVGAELRGEVMLSNARNRYLLARIERALGLVTAAQQAAAKRGRFVPAFAELVFGKAQEGALPALMIHTPGKRTIRLEGKIDRVDIAADEAAIAVIDYKLHGNTLALDRVYHGLSLQLLTYLLVLKESGPMVEGKKLSPAAAFYVKLLRGLEEVKHPSEAEEDPEMRDLKIKPRGIFEERYLQSLDAKATTGASNVISAFVKADGACGNRGKTDVADAAELAALLGHVRSTIGRLADRMIDGLIEVRPYLLNRASPCSYCEYRPVCRFDSAINRYQTLSPMKREDVLERVKEEGV